MRGGSRHGSQVVDGFRYLLVDLCISSGQGETLSPWTFDANAHDGGDTGARLGAMDGDVETTGFIESTKDLPAPRASVQ